MVFFPETPVGARFPAGFRFADASLGLGNSSPAPQLDRGSAHAGGAV